MALFLPNALPWTHHVREDVIRYVCSHGLSGDVIKREVNPAVNPRSRFFISHRAKAGI